ncbi:Aste57867_10699 [Aphanomyces stellatus]|uniref:Aste57867_10699 protein n=1 Tax=Aphanomyces stellatus TaxID=120398 RepID=A0A485KS55_9STRA|nr:hypothetical protein As57867_010659 [Aphanomyces stellatus]VFT87569.1 Aste57867_10699 [Aphanomyces stellatus]
MVGIPCDGCNFVNPALIRRCIRCKKETADDKVKIQYLCAQVAEIQTRYAELEENMQLDVALLRRERAIAAKEQKCKAIMVEMQVIAASLEDERVCIMQQRESNCATTLQTATTTTLQGQDTVASSVAASRNHEENIEAGEASIPNRTSPRTHPVKPRLVSTSDTTLQHASAPVQPTPRAKRKRARLTSHATKKRQACSGTQSWGITKRLLRGGRSKTRMFGRQRQKWRLAFHSRGWVKWNRRKALMVRSTQGGGVDKGIRGASSTRGWHRPTNQLHESDDDDDDDEGDETGVTMVASPTDKSPVDGDDDAIVAIWSSSSSKTTCSRAVDSQRTKSLEEMIRCVPVNWTWSSHVQCQTMWHLWFQGNKEDALPPLRHLAPIFGVRNSRSNVQAVAATKRVVNKLVDIALANEYVASVAALEALTSTVALRRVFQRAFHVLMARNPEGNLDDGDKCGDDDDMSDKYVDGDDDGDDENEVDEADEELNGSNCTASVAVVADRLAQKMFHACQLFTWTSDGTTHWVPQTWRLYADVSCRCIWRLWFRGTKTIGPFRMIPSCEWTTNKYEATIFQLMDTLTTLAISQGLVASVGVAAQLPMPKLMALFDDVFQMWMAKHLPPHVQSRKGWTDGTVSWHEMAKWVQILSKSRRSSDIGSS